MSSPDFDRGRREGIAEAVTLLDREIAWRRNLGRLCDDGSREQLWAHGSADIVVGLRDRIARLVDPPVDRSAFARGVREVLGLRPLRRAFWRWVGR